jgi:hypothetical protein
MPEPAPRRLWPFLAVMALVGVALGGTGVLWVSRRPAPAPPQQTASVGPLEPVKHIEPPPPPPAAAPHPSTEGSPAKEPTPVGTTRAESTSPEPTPGRERPTTRKRLRPEKAKAAEPHTVATAEPTKAVEPEKPTPPPDGIKPEARKLLDQAEDALANRKPLDAARLVDQSFFIQKTSLGYAIQARAACQRHDIGGARAAIRNITEPQLKQIVLRTCVRQGVWLF